MFSGILIHGDDDGEKIGLEDEFVEIDVSLGSDGGSGGRGSCGGDGDLGDGGNGVVVEESACCLSATEM